MADLTREQFIDQVLQHISEKFPLVKVSRGETHFALRIDGQVASLENIYRMTLLRPEQSRQHIERWIVELLRAAEGTPDRTGKLDDVKDRILPMVLPGSPSDKPTEGISQVLVDGLQVAYAIDGDRTISYITRQQFESWNITLDELHEIALANLVQRSEAIEAQAAHDGSGNINLILFQTLDGYDASRVLLPTLHQKLRQYLGSPFAAGIPNRDILLCFRNDDETVQRLSAQIAEDYRQMPHQVTEKLLLITADGLARRSS
jgi:uncharacterized protein YtpQ (UPF0354 family)